MLQGIEKGLIKEFGRLVGRPEREDPKPNHDKSTAIFNAYGEKLDAMRSEQREVGERISGKFDQLKQQEEAMKAALPGQLDAHSSAVDARLNELLAETGIQADIGRGQAGAAMAGRGLLRSTAGAEAIGEVSLQEQEQRQRAMMNAEQVKTVRKEQAQGAIRDIEQRREQMAMERDLATERQLNQQIFQMEIKQQEATWNAKMAEFIKGDFEAEKAKAERRQLMGGIGSVFGAVIGGYFGGPQGAALGAQAGQSSGSAWAEF